MRLRILLAAGLTLSTATSGAPSCRDYPRFDGKPYSGAELYTCATYCQTQWCSEKSYVTPKSAGASPPTYVDGELDMYFTIKHVERNPKNMTAVPPAWDSAAYYFAKGYHYDYWDGELVKDKLNSSDKIWDYVDTAGPPPPGLEEACARASGVLGLPTYLVDDGWKFCEAFPEHLKAEDRNYSFPDGVTLDPYYWWDSGCKIARDPQGLRNTFWWSCKVADNNTMIWDANDYGADPTDSTNTQLVTWGFNLPWDVACCCCGGGTAANQPGSQMIFKVEPEFPEIAVKLSSPNYTDLERFLQPYGDERDGLFINITGHPDWKDVLYPQWRSIDFKKGLVYTFPNLTYPADYPATYPYDQADKDKCSDLTLGIDIENHTISFKGHTEWLDWSGYNCRYYSQDACADGRASLNWNNSGWGPFQFFYNGHIKNGTGHGPNNGTSLRAHAGNVCCACGGGKLHGQLVRPTDDYDYDLNKAAARALHARHARVARQRHGRARRPAKRASSIVSRPPQELLIDLLV